MSWEILSVGKSGIVLQKIGEVMLNSSRGLEFLHWKFENRGTILAPRSPKSCEVESYKVEFNSSWALQIPSCDLWLRSKVDIVVIEEFVCDISITAKYQKKSGTRWYRWKSLDEESAPCAFVESFLKKLHLEEYVENFEQKNRHPVHSESRFSKKMHLEESPENFGWTNCILYTRSLSLKNRLP